MASSAYFILEGALGEGLGTSISGAGDFAQTTGPDEFIIGTRNDTAVGAIIFEGASFSTTGIEADASNLDFVRILSNTGEGTGTVVLGGVDIDGDGFDDVLISAPLSDGGIGAVYVLYGGETALDGSDLNISTSPLNGTNGSLINGFDSSDGFGSSLAVNEDSVGPTVLIGGPEVGLGSLSQQGGVASVDASGAIGASTDVTGYDQDGENGGDKFGTSIAAGFDMDGDGEGDIAAGAPGFDGAGTDRGKVYVQLDGASFEVIGAADADMAGTIVSSAGDINNDGFDDLMITAPGHGAADQGAVYIIYGKDDAVDAFDATYNLASLAAADGIKLSGGISNGEVGIDAVNVGDVSGDGIDDILIAGFDSSGAGRAYLVFGSEDFDGATITSLDLETLDGTNGYILSNIDIGPFGNTIVVGGLGDVNNDGINDFAIGTPDAAFGDGKVFGLLGGTENLAGLDSADGTDDGEIDVGAYLDGTPPEAAFIETDATVTFGGTTTGTIDLVNNVLTVQGLISITDLNDGTASFLTAQNGSGVTGRIGPDGTLGTVVVDDDGIDNDADRWTYTVTTAAVVYLGAGQVAADQVILTASNGSQRAINITIIGKDDPTDFSRTTPDANGFGITDDLFSISGTFAAIDPDQNQNTDFGGQTVKGIYGIFIINNDGDRFTYVLDQQAIQNAGGGPVTEEIFLSGTPDPLTFDIEAGTGTYVLDDGDTDEPGVTVFFGEGDQDVTGSAQGDRIDTGKGDDTVNGGDGNDVITDPFGDNTLSGGDGNDSVTALSGQNIINDDGGDGDDVNYLQGGVGRDNITGGDGIDYIKGDISDIIGGDDRLDGRAGNDFLSGGLGADTFVFGAGYGADRIAAFDVTPSGSTFFAVQPTRDFTVGLDVVELILGAPTNFAALDIQDVSGNAVLDLGGGDTLTFVGVSSADLTEDSFVFNFV